MLDESVLTSDLTGKTQTHPRCESITYIYIYITTSDDWPEWSWNSPVQIKYVGRVKTFKNTIRKTKFTRIVSYCYKLVYSLSSFMTFYMDPCGLTFCQETLIKSQVGPHGTLGAVMFVPSSTWKAKFLLSFFSFLSPLKSWKWTSYIRYASSWLYVEHILIHSSYFLWFNERRDCDTACKNAWNRLQRAFWYTEE